MPWSKLPKYHGNYENNARSLTYCEAINEALDQSMAIDPSVFVLGEGVDDPGAIFGSTKGLAEKYGHDRVMDMPLAENSMAGIAIGAAHVGMRPVCVHMRTDFLLLAFDQIANHAAKWNYMFGGKKNNPLVVRAIIGRGWGSGAQHAQALHPLFMHFPGLRVIAPSNPLDAKGMLLSAIRSPDPVLMFEHRWLYSLSSSVPEEMVLAPLEGAQVLREGDDVTIVTSGLACRTALSSANEITKAGISPEIIDLRSLKPMDTETIESSVRKTGRLIVFDYSWETCGVGAEVVSRVATGCFDALKTAPLNIALPECPIPAGHVLESAFYPGENDLVEAVKTITGYDFDRRYYKKIC